jgi:hypothetical protein
VAQGVSGTVQGQRRPTSLSPPRRSGARGIAFSREQRDRVRIYNEKLLRLPWEKAAKIILDGVEANKPRILAGNDAKVIGLAVRLLPRQYPRLNASFDKRLFGVGRG